MKDTMELKFDDLEKETNIDEIAKEVLKEMDENVFEYDVNTEIVNKAHIIDSDGEIFSLDE